jgi:uncharacterized protein YegL
MGLAKYLEDIRSRYVADSLAAKARRVVRDPVPEAAAKAASSIAGRNHGIINKIVERSMSALGSFTVANARPLPVIILADTSGSMSENGKIQALNTALADMTQSFAQDVDGRAEIHVAIITFGGTAKVHQSLTPAAGMHFQPLVATGKTPMGDAFDLARELIEDRQKVPGRAYSPVIVLASDAQPNDGTRWEEALERLLSSERAKKAQRFALGIGAGVDATALKRFVADPNVKIYGAADAAEIAKFFRWVTMSVSSRSRRPDPESARGDPLPPIDLDELL